MASIVRPFVVDRVMKRRGKVHLFESLPPRETALVVIDMQNTFMKPGGAVEVPASRELVDPINDLAETVRSRGGLVVWIAHANNVLPAEGTNDWSSFTNRFVGGEMRTRTAQSLAPGAEGQKLWADLRVHQNDLVIQKNRYSALIQGSSQLERILRSSGRTTILLAGTKTDVCVESTGRDAMMLDFDVVIVEDCCASLSREEHRDACETFLQCVLSRGILNFTRRQFGDVMTSGEVAEALEKGAQ